VPEKPRHVSAADPRVRPERRPRSAEEIDTEGDEAVPVERADDPELFVRGPLRNDDGVGEGDEARDGVKAYRVVPRGRQREKLARRAADGTALEDVAPRRLARKAASRAHAVVGEEELRREGRVGRDSVEASPGA
jgi:hypothetical protein